MHLDKYLVQIPDQPKIPGYEQYCTAESNSILDHDKLIVNTAQQGSLCPSGHPSGD